MYECVYLIRKCDISLNKLGPNALQHHKDFSGNEADDPLLRRRLVGDYKLGATLSQQCHAPVHLGALLR